MVMRQTRVVTPSLCFHCMIEKYLRFRARLYSFRRIFSRTFLTILKFHIYSIAHASTIKNHENKNITFVKYYI